LITIVCALRDITKENTVISNIGENKCSQIIFVEGKNPSYQRNAGVKEATGDIIYFVDDDSVLPAGILQKAESYFDVNPSAAVLGGPELSPKTDSVLQKSFGAVFSSVFAAGKSSLRYRQFGAVRESDEKEIILSNMFVRKSIFEELQGFNEKLYPNEENEFLSRVIEHGYKITHDPNLFIYRSKRNDFAGFIKQCFNYGRGRTEQSFINFSLSGLINYVPAFFVIYLLTGLLLGGMGLFPLIIYIVLNAIFSALIGIKTGQAKDGLLAFVNFFLLHIAYGTGTLYGFITSATLKDRQTDMNIQMKKTVL